MDEETIFRQLLFVTVRLECKRGDDVAVGTATLVTHPNLDGEGTVWLATNKHVVEGATFVEFFFVAKEKDRPKYGSRHEVGMPIRDVLWHGHPNPDVDVVVSPLGPILQILEEQNADVFYRTIHEEMVPTDDDLRSIDLVKEVFFVGYPLGMFDRANLLPLVRRGITATPLHTDYERRPEFLIDAAVFPGSSGSPVFFSWADHFEEGPVYFAGVISKQFRRREEGEIEFVDIPTTMKPVAGFYQDIHLGVVAKAHTVFETIKDWFMRYGCKRVTGTDRSGD